MTTDGGPSDREIVDAATDAAEDVIFVRYRRTELRDIDLTISFADGELSVDVFLDAGDDATAAAVADDAALAARAAVDALLE